MTAAQVYAALRVAWIALLGTQPPRASLLTLLAQWSVETGGGGASNNWNLGGIKHTPGDGSNFALYPTQERFARAYAQTLIAAGHATMARDDGGETILVALEQKFRAYPDLDTAAADYLRTLRHDFGFAWPAVESGDTQDFAHRLKARSYYTATESSYASALATRYVSLDRQIPEDSPDDTPTTPDSPTALADGRPAYVPPEPERDPPPEAA